MLTSPSRWQCETCGQEGSVCLYWRTHGYSPGEWSDPQDTLAIDLHLQARAIGWESVWALRILALTKDEADQLAGRLAWIEQYVKTMPTQPAITESE